MTTEIIPTEIENEDKCIVTEDVFYRILGLNKIIVESNYVNHYFDTPNLYLFNFKNSLRVREESNKYRLDLKVLDRETQGIEEYQAALDLVQYKRFESRGMIPASIVKKKLYQIIPKNRIVKNQGYVMVKEYKINHNYGSDVRIYFDANKFLGSKIDHEIEIESDKGKTHANLIMQDLQSKYNFPYVPAKSKYERLINFKKSL